MAALTGMVNGQQEGVSTTAFYRSGDVKTACTWQATSHDFGTIGQGKPVSHTYSFTNTGKEPLIISAVKPGCGCTTPDYSKEPVAPGKKGFVTLTYNASAAGRFTKSATVTTNNESFVLTFSGEVVAAGK